MGKSYGMKSVAILLLSQLVLHSPDLILQVIAGLGCQAELITGNNYFQRGNRSSTLYVYGSLGTTLHRYKVVLLGLLIGRERGNILVEVLLATLLGGLRQHVHGVLIEIDLGIAQEEPAYLILARVFAGGTRSSIIAVQEVSKLHGGNIPALDVILIQSGLLEGSLIDIQRFQLGVYLFQILPKSRSCSSVILPLVAVASLSP